MKKKALALILSLIMIVQMAPVGTFASAADGTEMELVCTQESHTHDDSCKETVLTCTMEETTEGENPHTHEAGCFSIKLLCGKEETEGHTHSDACKESTLTCELPEDETHTHEEECYTQSMVCGLEEIEAHTHKKDCFSYVCGKTEHQHSDGCYAAVKPFNEEEANDETTAPSAEVTEPSTEATEPSTEATEPSTEATDPSTEATEPSTEATEPSTEATEPSTESTEPTEPETPEAPKVGDAIWIKPGEVVYKSTTDEKGYTLSWKNYEVKITEVIPDENGAAAWYKFEYVNLGVGEIFLSLQKYFYVQAASTSVKEPDASEPEGDSTVCDCENPPEKLSQHADSCPRKHYIKTLFEGKTAEEIYADWATYDETTRNDLLEMLEVYNPTLWTELKKLVTETDEKETIVGDISIKVQGVPADVTLNSDKVTSKDYSEELFETVGLKKILFGFDISLVNDDNSEWQPEDGKPVTVSMDAASLGLADGERIGILHEHEGELKDLGVVTVADGLLTFETDGFSVFYGYTVDFEYNGRWFSIFGGNGIFLGELFAELGIDRSASSVTSVQFSDPSLIEVSKKVFDGYTGETAWHLQSLQAFDTSEELTITFSDATEIIINAFDANVGGLTDGATLNDGDVITGNITVSGNITITVNGTVTTNGTITIQENASLTITGSGTIRRGDSFNGKMFDVPKGGTLKITDVDLDGGASWSSTPVSGSTRNVLTVTKGGDVYGAAIYVDTGNVFLSNVTIKNMYTKNNSAGQNAAAIHVTGMTKDSLYATVEMNNVTVTNCATHSGHSITMFNEAIATLTNCTYTNNHADRTHAGVIKAGGPANFCQLTMKNCTATGNYSSGWGGVILWAAGYDYGNKVTKAVIDGCKFENNKARYLGGAISNEAIMEITNTTIKNNEAMAGGGIATFPFTLTTSDAEGANACGLTLGTGNVIEENIASANGSFKPFNTADTTDGNYANTDYETVTNVIEYPGGGGGIWCYMNKANWKCGFIAGSENRIIDNTSKSSGGGIYVHHDAGTQSTLSVTGAEITGNSAVTGGGIGLANATLNVYSGEIKNNTATQFGGGVYISNGICTIQDPEGSTDEHADIRGNTAANGGGLYIDEGSSLTISGGIVTANGAIGTPLDADSAYNDSANCGVGGGIYISNGTDEKKSSFTMEGTYVGLYGNTADFAAADAYASGNNTELTLPSVAGMRLEGILSYRATGWYADYKNGSDDYYPGSILMKEGSGTTNPGRYTEAEDKNVEAEYSVLSANKTSYYCLTIGTAYPGYGDLTIVKTLTEPVAEDQTILFYIVGETKFKEQFAMTVAMSLKKGDSEARVTIKDIPDGHYTITEDQSWSWRYELKETTYTYELENEKVNINIATPIWVATFKNACDEKIWLDGSSWCQNIFGKDAIVRKQEQQKGEGGNETE